MATTSPRPAVQQVGGAVIVQGDNCLQHLMACVLVQMKQMKGNGYAPPPELLDMFAKANTARMSASGQEFASYVAAETDSTHQSVDIMSTAEAAQVLGTSPRNCRRMASQLLGRRVTGNAWVFDREAVHALAAERRRRR